MKHQSWTKWLVMIALTVSSNALASTSKNWSMAFEASLANYLNFAARGETTAPPDLFLLEAQTTIWFRNAIGLHLRGGGMMGLDGGNKKLIYGAGGRLSLFSLSGSQKVLSKARAWFGVDYCYILEALDTENVPYPKNSVEFVYSFGLELAAGESIYINPSVAVFPYRNYFFFGPSLAVGYRF